MNEKRNITSFWVAAILVAIVAAVEGCAKPAGVLFPLPEKRIFWPAPPEMARVRYVGQLATSRDHKAPVSFGERLGKTLFVSKSAFSMLSPYALCTDGHDRLFVADSNAQCVHVFDMKTRKYTHWAPRNANKRFDQPVGIAYDPAGRLFVSDSVAKLIYVFDKTGKEIAQIGAGYLTRPAGLAFDPQGQRLFAADVGAHNILIFSAAGQPLARLGHRGTRLGEFNFPTNVAIDAHGRLYVSDSLNFRVQQFSPDFRSTIQIGRKGDMPGYFSQPKGIAIDSDDHIYVVDANFESVQIFDANGELLLDFGSEGAGAGEFWLPAGVFIDSTNRIWVADTYNRRVQVFDYLPEGTP